MKNKVILLVILVIAAFFRLYLLSSVPPSASLDEASIGWNAYSILQTGKDEYGNHLPILLRAYDDYRPALYVYAVVPFVKFLGLSVVSVRLPSVLFSIISVFGTYLLVKEFFKKKSLPKFLSAENIALLTSFFLAISPWHIYISRLGHEVNFGLSFLIFAVFFFLRNRIYLSALLFILSFMSYQSEKIFIPLLVLGMFFIFRKEILSIKKKVIIAGILGLILLLPFLKASLDPNALIRFSGTNVLKVDESRFIDQSLKLSNGIYKNDLIGKVIYNRRVLALQIITEGYLSHFNPVWLFTNASGDNHKVPNLGLLYIWELPLIIFGMYFLVRYNFDRKTKKLVFLWFLLSAIPAAITTDTPHALRTFVFLPMWQIFSGIGFLCFINYFKKGFIKNSILTLSAIIIFFSMLSLYRNYFFAFPVSQSRSFQYALSQAIPVALENKNSYKKIVFDNNDELFQSYMFFLFYGKYDPKLYLNQGGTKSGGYSVRHKFGEYEFRPINIPSEPKGNLYVINYRDLKTIQKNSYKLIKIIPELDKMPAIAVISK